MTVAVPARLFRPESSGPPMHLARADAEPWRWSYSPWVGIMYGPVPVGLIIAIPLMLLLWL